MVACAGASLGHVHPTGLSAQGTAALAPCRGAGGALLHLVPAFPPSPTSPSSGLSQAYCTEPAPCCGWELQGWEQPVPQGVKKPDSCGMSQAARVATVRCTACHLQGRFSPCVPNSHPSCDAASLGIPASPEAQPQDAANEGRLLTRDSRAPCSAAGSSSCCHCPHCHPPFLALWPRAVAKCHWPWAEP